MTDVHLLLAPAALALVALVGSSMATLAWTRHRTRIDVADAWHTVEEEVAWLRRCAEAFAYRHGSVVRFTFLVTEGARRRLVPRAMLQTLFDEAVHFGAMQSEGERTVLARAVAERLSREHPRASLRIESSSEGTRSIFTVPPPRSTGER